MFTNRSLGYRVFRRLRSPPPSKEAMSVSERLWNETAERRSRHRLQAGENFPAATRLLPGRHRAHLLNVYRYVRLVDNIGDEDLPGERAVRHDLMYLHLDSVRARSPVERQVIHNHTHTQADSQSHA